MDRKRIAVALILVLVLVVAVILIVKKNKCPKGKKDYGGDKGCMTEKEHCESTSGKVWNGTACVTAAANNTSPGTEKKECTFWLTNERCLVEPEPNDFVYYKKKGEDFYRTAQYKPMEDVPKFESFEFPGDDSNTLKIENDDIVDILDAKNNYITDIHLKKGTTGVCEKNQVLLSPDTGTSNYYYLCGDKSSNPTSVVEQIKPSVIQHDQFINKYPDISYCELPFKDIDSNVATYVDTMFALPELVGEERYKFWEGQKTCVKKTENKDGFKSGLFFVLDHNDKIKCPEGSTSVGDIMTEDKVRLMNRACVPN